MVETVIDVMFHKLQSLFNEALKSNNELEPIGKIHHMQKYLHQHFFKDEDTTDVASGIQSRMFFKMMNIRKNCARCGSFTESTISIPFSLTPNFKFYATCCDDPVCTDRLLYILLLHEFVMGNLHVPIFVAGSGSGSNDRKNKKFRNPKVRRSSGRFQSCCAELILDYDYISAANQSGKDMLVKCTFDTLPTNSDVFIKQRFIMNPCESHKYINFKDFISINRPRRALRLDFPPCVKTKQFADVIESLCELDGKHRFIIEEMVHKCMGYNALMLYSKKHKSTPQSIIRDIITSRKYF